MYITPDYGITYS